jgi:hypothetical protein
LVFITNAVTTVVIDPIVSVVVVWRITVVIWGVAVVVRTIVVVVLTIVVIKR